jgi:hypothetical protein
VISLEFYNQGATLRFSDEPSESPSETELRFHNITQLYRTIRTAIRVGGCVLIAYFAFRALESLGGQNTAVSLVVSLILDAFVELKFVLIVTLAGSAIAWAVAERWLRYRKVKQMQERIKRLETLIDPRRTTSGLTPAGRTNPRDRIS